MVAYFGLASRYSGKLRVGAGRKHFIKKCIRSSEQLSALIIDRYIIAEVARPFGIGVVLLVVVFAGYSSAIQLSEAATGLIRVSTAGSLILLKTLAALEILLPTAFYLSVLSAIGRMHRDSEIIALNSVGVSEKRILFSVFKLAIVVAVVVGLLSLFGRPWAYRESYRLEAEAVSSFDISKMEAGKFLELQGGRYVLFARSVDVERGLLKGVFLKSEQGKKSRVIYAKEASLKQALPGTGYLAELRDGYSFLLDRLGHKDVTFRFNVLEVHMQEEAAGTSYNRKAEPTRSLALSDRPRDVAEYQWRQSTPLATVLLALLAVPLSRSGQRRSRFRNFFIAILVYAIVFNLIILARNLVEQGGVGSVPGLWWAYGFPAGLLAILLYEPRLLNRMNRA